MARLRGEPKWVPTPSTKPKPLLTHEITIKYRYFENFFDRYLSPTFSFSDIHKFLSRKSSRPSYSHPYGWYIITSHLLASRRLSEFLSAARIADLAAGSTLSRHMSIYKLIQNNPVLQELVEEYVKEKMVWRYMEWWFEDHENGQQNWADYWEFLILKRWEHGEMPELWVNRTRFEFEGEGYGPDPKDAQKTAQELLIEAVEENLPTEEKESGGTTDLAGFDDTLLDTTREGSVTANGLKIKFSVKKEGEYIELDDDEEVEEDADADADADAEEEEEDGSEENETDQGESEDSVKEESATEEGSEEDVEEQPSGVEESEEDEFVDALEDVEDGTEEYYEAGQDYEDSENEDEDDDEDEDEDENDDENEEGEEEEVQSIVISEPAVRHTIKLRFRMPITPPEPKPKIEAEAAKEPKREDDVTGRGIEMGISGGGNQNKRGRDDMEEGVAEDSDEEWTLGGGEGDSSGRRPRKKKRVSWAD